MERADFKALGERLRAAVADRGTSIRALEIKLKMPKNRLASIVWGHRPRAETIDAVVAELRIGREWLMTGAGEMNDYREGGADRVGEDGAAYGGCIVVEELATASAAEPDRIAYTEHEPRKLRLPAGAHLVRISGESMFPLARDSQWVWCVPEQPKDGDLALIELTNDDEVLFRRVSRTDDGGWVATPVNQHPDYKPRVLRKSDIRRMKKVAGTWYIPLG